jgi:hypothetical protein
MVELCVPNAAVLAEMQHCRGAALDSLSHHPKRKSMNQFKFSCPHCKQHLQCDEQFSGREIQCPSCNVLIRIPAVPGKTAQYNPEVGKTWATHVPAGNVPVPEGLVIEKKADPNRPKS